MNDNELKRLVNEFVRKERKQFEDNLDKKVKVIYTKLGNREKVNKAEEMFNKLGYRKREIDVILSYTKTINDIEHNILFDKVKKGVCCIMGTVKFVCFDMQEFKAIQQQIKELGWLDE